MTDPILMGYDSTVFLYSVTHLMWTSVPVERICPLFCEDLDREAEGMASFFTNKKDYISKLGVLQ